MNENKMYCFHCQKTSKGTGCTVKGVLDIPVPVPVSNSRPSYR